MAAKKHKDALDSSQFIMIPVEGDPVTIAQSLIQDTLPRTFIDQIDISNDEGMARLITCLILRKNQASLEKDELFRFVHHNWVPLQAGRMQLLNTFASAIHRADGEEETAEFFNYFLMQVQHILDGHPSQVDVKSDRLLWLLYALSLCIENQSYTYLQARTVLEEKEHRDRISPLSIRFMIKDFIDTIETPNQPNTVYAMLIAECALLSNDLTGIAVGIKLVTMLHPPKDTASWLDFLLRTSQHLERNNRLDADSRAFVQRATARYQNTDTDDDF